MRVNISILICFVITGCSQKSKIPENILSQQEMRAVMWDLVRADEYISSNMIGKDTAVLRTQRLTLYEQIFRLHSINQEKFKKSLSFYQTRPDLLKVITDSLRTEERKVLEFKNRENIPAVDSIRKRPGFKPPPLN